MKSVFTRKEREELKKSLEARKPSHFDFSFIQFQIYGPQLAFAKDS